MAIAWLQILPCKHFNMLWRKESELIKLNTTQWMSLAFSPQINMCHLCCTSIWKILIFWIEYFNFIVGKQGKLKRSVLKIFYAEFILVIYLLNIYYWTIMETQILFATLKLYSLFIISILDKKLFQKYIKSLCIL